MSMTSWAEREVEIACKKENPERKEGEFDYGCACYESALKAFKSLMEDGQSGASIRRTKDVLVRLIEGKVLTPIDENDGWIYAYHTDNRDSYQSTRMSSLFKDVYSDGTVRYHDINRVVCIDENGHGFYSGFVSRVIHDLYPIEMPYYPGKTYRVDVEDFLLGPQNGDFDTMGIISVTLPNGTVRELNKYYKEGGHSWVEITKEEYYERKKCSEVKINEYE